MIKEIFDKWAEDWDSVCYNNEGTIRNLLRMAEIKPENSVLDVGCGTGILEQYLLEIGVSKLVAIDFAPNMIKKAEGKYKGKNIDFRCVDLFEMDEAEKFDRIILYNVFPHFPHPEQVFGKISKMMNPSGRILICHGSSRLDVNEGYEKLETKIAVDMKTSEEISELMKPYFYVDNTVDNDCMFAVTGTLK